MSQPFFSIDLKDKIEFISLSPYEWSQSLLFLGFKSKLKVGVLKFQEEYDDLEQEIEFEQIEEFFHSPRVHAVSWSPAASLNKIPKLIEFCVAGSDFSLRFFQTDLSNNRHLRKEVDAHTDYINDCAFDFEGEYLASISDDCTCKLWSAINSDHIHTFNLTSPGMALTWHQDEVGKLLVGEKTGLIRLYNVITLQPLGSHYCFGVPLVSLSWSPQSKFVALLTAGELVVMDLNTASLVVDSKVIHSGGGYKVSFCLANENYVATAGRPNNTLKISHVRSHQVLVSTNLQVFGGFSWHYRLPYLCVANNNNLNFFRISPK